MDFFLHFCSSYNKMQTGIQSLFEQSAISENIRTDLNCLSVLHSFKHSSRKSAQWWRLFSSCRKCISKTYSLVSISIGVPPSEIILHNSTSKYFGFTYFNLVFSSCSSHSKVYPLFWSF